MGIYLNPGNIDFQQSLNSKIYVDKSMLIDYTNSLIYTEQKYICVSRPRRFGKSMAANMLSAYYDCKHDSRQMFKDLKISGSDSYEQHINKYNVIRINMQNFLNESHDINEMIRFIEEDLTDEIKEAYPDVKYPKRQTLIKILATVFSSTNIPFVIIIDEWDCVLRDSRIDSDEQKKYLDFLCDLFKDQRYVALGYMTGILPIKKYGKHSAINVFYEYSMTDADPIAEFTGFTEQEVKDICEKYGKSFSEMKRWYDGYCVNGISIYNPKSVVESVIRGNFNNYWTSTETYEALKVYIEMNFDGLKDTITKLLAGQKAVIDTTTFTNDMVTFSSKDDVLTLLIHLGYLTYDFNTKEVSIPNYEISEQYASTIRVMGWSEVEKSLKISEDLLKATLECNENRVAELIEQAHQDNTSILKYNDENSLSCVLSLAYYSARKTYTIERELPAGKGYADLVFRPRENNSNPAVIIELKYGHSTEEALEQIKDNQYADCLKGYSGEVLLVGINYDKKTKKHNCSIEKMKI